LLAVGLVSVNVGGTAAGNGPSGPGPILTSADGRFVAFVSDASDLTTIPDTNAVSDIFVRDQQTGVTTLVSVNAAGTAAGDRSSTNFSMSADGRFVAFQSEATDLVAGDSNDTTDVFVRDLQAGTTTLVSVSVFSSSSLSGNGPSFDPFISADGGVVAFNSFATDLVNVSDGNETVDVFARDLGAGTTTMLSTSVGGSSAGDGPSFLTSGFGERTGRHLSDDGQFIVFESQATDLVPFDSNTSIDVFVFHLDAGTKALVSVNEAGDASGNGPSITPAISADGQFVAFASDASDLTPDTDGNGTTDVFVRDLSSGATSLASVSTSGGSGNARSRAPVLSADGLVVVFESDATDLTSVGDDNGLADVFARDLESGVTTLVSVNAAGTAAGNGRSQRDVETEGLVAEYGISPDGRFVTFESDAGDLVSSPATEGTNAFARDLLLGITTLLSLNVAGDDGGNGIPGGGAVTDAGQAFFSDTATNLVSLPDTNDGFDIFAASLTGRIQFAQTTFTSPEAGDQGPFAVITLTRTNGAVGTATVLFSTADGTATAGLDYVAVTRTVTFAEGQVVQVVTIPLLDDNLVEDSETVFLALSEPLGADLGSPSQSVLILVNDDVTSVSVADVAVVEGDAGSTPAVFVVRLSNPSSFPITYAYSTADGTATAGVDYLPTSGLLTFAPGETEKTVPVIVLGNLEQEGDETFFLQIFAVEFGEGGPEIGPLLTRGTCVIVDDDEVTVSIADVAVVEGDAGSTPAVFVVRLSNPSSFPITYAYSTADGTATAGVDYLPASGLLAFAPGETEKTVAVSVLGDLNLEYDETFFLQIFAYESGEGGTEIGPLLARGTCVIVEDDSLVVVNTNDEGRGSLRKAILVANATQGADTIVFAIPGAGVQTIRPRSELPVVTGPTVVDGYTQPGSSPNSLARGTNAVLRVELDGRLLGAGASGLLLAGGSSVVQGLSIYGFGSSGVVLADGGGNAVRGNFFGVDAGGNRVPGAGLDGVLIVGSSGNFVGGFGPWGRNLISGQDSVGIQILGHFPLPVDDGPDERPGTADDVISLADSRDNFVMNNLVGTDATGTRALGNGQGIFINSASNNVVADNVVSGNVSVGIQVFGPRASGNRILGNRIGTDAAGLRPLGNGTDGVFVNGAPRNVVGPSNIISANTSVGVQIFGPEAAGNVVASNLIGTDASGTRALGNGTDGVFLNNAPGNVVGGAEAGLRNLISANGFSGVEIAGAGASGNLVAGNLIGTDISGTRPLGNRGYGVLLFNTTGNTIGVAAPNTIAFNAFGPVQAFRGPIPILRGFGGNTVQGNILVGNSVATGRRNRPTRPRQVVRATVTESVPSGPTPGFRRRGAAPAASGRA
jgi:parallel beta-helix repeat protein